MPDSCDESVRVLRVVAKRKRNPLATASADDFELLEQGRVNAADAILANPQVTPYCFDVDRRALLLIEAKAGASLMGAPFLYDAQYASAQCVYALSLDGLNRLTTNLPDPENPLFLYSTGRCGSTLLVKAMAELGYAATWSEPDIFTQFALAGPQMDSTTRAVVVDAMRGCLRLLRRPGHAVHVIKLRSIAIEHMELLADAIPGAKRLFIYRNAVDFARSSARILGLNLADTNAGITITAAWRMLAPLLQYNNQSRISSSDLLASLWAGSVLRYLDTYPTGHWLGAVRYEDLSQHAQGVMAWLLRELGLPAHDARRALPAFGRDSQAGTPLARLANDTNADAEGAENQIARSIAQRLAQIRDDLTPEMHLPGTWAAGASAHSR